MFSIMRCFIANEIVMIPSACTSLISFALTHTHTWNSYSINRQCGKAVLKHAFITKNLSNIHTQVTIYTNVFRFFLAMSDYQGFLGEESPDSCNNVVDFWGVSRDELWNESGSFHCLTSSYLEGENKRRRKERCDFPPGGSQLHKSSRRSRSLQVALQLPNCGFVQRAEVKVKSCVCDVKVSRFFYEVYNLKEKERKMYHQRAKHQI